MKNLKLASFFAALTLGALSYTPLNALQENNWNIPSDYDAQIVNTSYNQYDYAIETLQPTLQSKNALQEKDTENVAHNPTVEDIHNWLAQNFDNIDHNNFYVLLSRCPKIQDQIKYIIATCGATQEILNALVNFIKEWRQHQPLLNIIAEMPENSVWDIDNLKKIFVQTDNWYNDLENKTLRAYVKKCAIDREFNEYVKQECNELVDLHNTIKSIHENLLEDLDIIESFPQNILTKCSLYPKLFNELIRQGNMTSDQEAFLQDLEILGEKLTPNQLVQLENSACIATELALTCNYITIKENIYEWIKINFGANIYHHDLVTEFFENQSIQNFIDASLALEEQPIIEILTFYFNLLLENDNPLFIEFYSKLLSSVSFESIEHLEIVMSQEVNDYVVHFWHANSLNNTTHWYDNPLMNSDVFITILNNPRLCKVMQNRNDWVIVDVVKNVIENNLNIEQIALFLTENINIFDQIIDFIVDFIIAYQNPQFKNNDIDIRLPLSNLIADLAELYALKDRGFIEWIFATKTENPTEALWYYTTTTDDYRLFDFYDNWPSRARLLRYHKPAVTVLKHIALMLEINREMEPQNLDAYLSTIPSLQNTQTNILLEKSPEIAIWVFDTNANDASNRITMLDALDNTMLNHITKYPRLARLIFNQQITTQKDLNAALIKYTQNNDPIIQEEINIALDYNLYEFKYTLKGFDPDYATSYENAFYPIQMLFGKNKLKELTQIIASYAGLDGWFYTTSHSNCYESTAIQTVISWLLTEFYDKPYYDWTDTSEHGNSRYKNLMNNANNFAFRDSELLHYAVYDVALFDFVMNNPQACIDLSKLITNSNTTQDEFAQAVIELTQHQENRSYLANHLIRIFIHAHAVTDLINDMLSFLGNFTYEKESPEFNQTLQKHIDDANKKLKELPNTPLLGDAHITMIKEILDSEANEKMITGRIKAALRWCQKYHPKASKVVMSSALFVSNALITTGKVITCVANPQTTIIRFMEEIIIQTLFSMGLEDVVTIGLITETAYTTFSQCSLKDLKNISNWKPILDVFIAQLINRAQCNPQAHFNTLMNNKNNSIQGFAQHLIQSIKQPLLNFIGTNGGWANFYETVTTDSEDIRFGKQRKTIQKTINNVKYNQNYCKIAYNGIIR